MLTTLEPHRAMPTHGAAKLSHYRTETPERVVYIRAAMFIDASSWKSNFAA